MRCDHVLTPGSWSHQTEAGEVDVAEAGAGHEARIAHQRGDRHVALLLYWYLVLYYLSWLWRRKIVEFTSTMQNFVFLVRLISSFQVL